MFKRSAGSRWLEDVLLTSLSYLNKGIKGLFTIVFTLDYRLTSPLNPLSVYGEGTSVHHRLNPLSEIGEGAGGAVERAKPTVDKFNGINSRRIALMLLLLFCSLPLVAQEATPFAPPAWEVYLERGVIGSADRLIFLDMLTGNSTRIEVIGERYTLLGDGVLYFDYLNQRVMLAQPDGTMQAHPFIILEAGARRVDWVVSADGHWVAWTLTYGEPAALTTRTYTATVEGANQQQVLSDGARDGIRALPVAFHTDNTRLYMDAQPNDLGRFSAYTQYAGLFSVLLADSTPTMLPNEPACYCGAGLQGDLFLRLTLTQDLSGFDVQVYDLRNGQRQTIPALRLNNYTQAGDLLIAPDGSQAVYALSRVENFGTPRQNVETVFMRVDLRAMTQDTLTAPVTTYIHPLRWTENNAAVIFTSPQQSGTWKVDLADGKLRKVAEATLIGILQAAYR